LARKRDLIARSRKTGCAASPAAAMLERNSRLLVTLASDATNEKAAVTHDGRSII
jgi:hypothetical protein